VSFDLAVGKDSQPVGILVRRGGGGTNGYESLQSTPIKLSGTSTFKRYSYTFKSLKTINVKDPVTLDNGARFDIESIMPEQSISISNLEVVPISSSDGNARADMLISTSTASQQFDCPVSSYCSQYLRLSDNTPIRWPYTLSPFSSEIIYAVKTRLVDTDRDSIADTQDKCPSTPASLTVNSEGCALGETP
jgi:hypothetical protein